MFKSAGTGQSLLFSFEGGAPAFSGFSLIVFPSPLFVSSFILFWFSLISGGGGLLLLFKLLSSLGA